MPPDSGFPAVDVSDSKENSIQPLAETKKASINVSESLARRKQSRGEEREDFPTGKYLGVHEMIMDARGGGLTVEASKSPVLL